MLTFLPDTATIAAFAVAALILIITPGPDLTLALSKAIAHGPGAGVAAVLGAGTGVLCHTLLAAFGLSALLAASETAFTIVKIAGGLYLLWLAYHAVRHGSAFTLSTGGERQAVSLRRVWLTGVGINLLNPKVVLFFVTFLPQFVSAADPHAGDKLLFLGLAFIVLYMPCAIATVLVADRIAGTLRRSRTVTRTIDYATAGIFGTFAAKILLARPS